MFDLRYHVASLTAVFLALIVGILVGVGISGRGFVSSTEREILQGQIRADQAGLEQKDQRIKQLSATESFIKQSYPALMHGRLKGKRVALLFVGPVDEGVRASVQDALSEAGASTEVRLRAIKVPIVRSQLDRSLTGRPGLRRYAGDSSAMGRQLGHELVRGGRAPLWNRLGSKLVLERGGPEPKSVDAVVVSRSPDPQRGETARFLRGLYGGLVRQRVPVVGVEESTETPSVVGVYDRAGFSSVDDVNTRAGKLALVLLLAGGKPGHYGIKPAADGHALPPVEPLPVAGTGG